MKIYIVTDMEGISGICNEEQVRPGTAAYEAARHLLSGDINAAVAGAFEGGANEVIVSDGHWGGRISFLRTWIRAQFTSSLAAVSIFCPVWMKRSPAYFVSAIMPWRAR